MINYHEKSHKTIKSQHFFTYLSGFSEFYSVPSFTRFYSVLLSFTQSYSVLLGFTRFYSVLLGVTFTRSISLFLTTADITFKKP